MPERPRAVSRRRWIVAGVTLVVVVGLSCAVWQRVRGHVLSSEQYQVDPRQIAITEPPAWVRADIRADVIRDASFAGSLSLLDPELTVRMATAFAAHPWVAHVQRVSKHFPSGLDVVLSYRRPVAMVEVQDGTGVFPVDAEGVVLPWRDFSPEEAASYPRIGEIHTTPTGPVGTRWGDAGVLGAAQVAAALAEEWKAFDLFKIVPAGRKPSRTGAEYVFTLYTHGGTSIDWGRSPGTDLPGELPAADKIALLKQQAAKNNGSLDQPDGAQLVIRADGALVARPRPSIKPLPKAGD